MLVIMINTVATLCATVIGFAEYDVCRFNELRLGDLNALASILGANSPAPLASEDPTSARNILGALAAKPHILAAVIYDHYGMPFVLFHRGGPKDLYSAPPVESDSSRFTSDRVLIFQGNRFSRGKSGSSFPGWRCVELKQLLAGFLVFFGLIVAVVSLGACAVAIRL
jgi:hypothetical protein